MNNNANRIDAAGTIEKMLHMHMQPNLTRLKARPLILHKNNISKHQYSLRRRESFDETFRIIVIGGRVTGRDD